MRHIDGTPRDIHVVVVAGGRFAVFFQRAVHHHGRETQLDRTLAHRGGGAVVLVNTHRNVREFFNRRQHQVTQERCARIFARAGGSLHDHRAIGFVRRFHHGAHLFQVVDVERRYAVAVFGGVVQ